MNSPFYPRDRYESGDEGENVTESLQDPTNQLANGRIFKGRSVEHLAAKGWEDSVRGTLKSGLSKTCGDWDKKLQPPAPKANHIMIGDGGKLNLQFDRSGIAIVASALVMAFAVILTACWIVINYAPWMLTTVAQSKFDKQDSVIEANRKDAAAMQAQQTMINGQVLDQLKDLHNRADLAQDSNSNNSDSIIQMQQLLMDRGLMVPRDVPKRRLHE